jgi:hypothetical protein
MKQPLHPSGWNSEAEAAQTAKRPRSPRFASARFAARTGRGQRVLGMKGTEGLGYERWLGVLKTRQEKRGCNLRGAADRVRRTAYLAGQRTHTQLERSAAATPLALPFSRLLRSPGLGCLLLMNKDQPP